MAAAALPVTPAQYDAWYDTPRGRWIGDTEYRLVRSLLDLQPGHTVLDVGCGTGWFTRRVVADDAQAFVLGLLNRHSLLWLDKGRQGGSGAYRGAHWHTRAEIDDALRVLPVGEVRYRNSVFLPSGSWIARALERALPSRLPLGSFLAVAGDVAR